MTIKYRRATIDDIQGVLELHYRYQIDSIKEEDKKDGFVTTAFDVSQLTDLIDEENGLFVGLNDEKIVAYAMAASWQFWSRWPMFAHMLNDLPNLSYAGEILSAENSYQYGPVCVDKSVRGQGVFEGVFRYSLNSMAARYPIMVTFINQVNRRSVVAHTQKVGLDVIQEFEYNGNQYYELACLTSIP